MDHGASQDCRDMMFEIKNGGDQGCCDRSQQDTNEFHKNSRTAVYAKAVYQIDAPSAHGSFPSAGGIVNGI